MTITINFIGKDLETNLHSGRNAIHMFKRLSWEMYPEQFVVTGKSYVPNVRILYGEYIPLINGKPYEH